MEKRKKRKPMEKHDPLTSKDSRGGVPSAPCREREHGRETLWIIIAQKSRKINHPLALHPPQESVTDNQGKKEKKLLKMQT